MQAHRRPAATAKLKPAASARRVVWRRFLACGPTMLKSVSGMVASSPYLIVVSPRSTNSGSIASLAWKKHSRPRAASQARRTAQTSSLHAARGPTGSPITTQLRPWTRYIRKASPPRETMKLLSPVKARFASVRSANAKACAATLVGQSAAARRGGGDRTADARTRSQRAGCPPRSLRAGSAGHCRRARNATTGRRYRGCACRRRTLPTG